MAQQQEKKKAAASGRHTRKASFKRWVAIFPKRRIRRVQRHIAAHPNDHAATAALARIESEAWTYAARPTEFALPKGKAAR